MRTDPADNGGLFVGRRPGTAPVHFRALPERGSERAPAHRRLAREPAARGDRRCSACSAGGRSRSPACGSARRRTTSAGSVSLGILVAFVGLFAPAVRRAVAAASPRPGVDPRAPGGRPRPAHGSPRTGLRAPPPPSARSSSRSGSWSSTVRARARFPAGAPRCEARRRPPRRRRDAVRPLLELKGLPWACSTTTAVRRR